MTDRTRICYIYETKVISVYEYNPVVSGRMAKNDEGVTEAVIEHESQGWFIRITDSSAIYVGMEKPDLAVGDTLRITMEKVASKGG